MQHRSEALETIIALVLAAPPKGIQYITLVTLIAHIIPDWQGTRYRLQRLKRTPSETTAETSRKGRQAVARRYIDSAHRYGRITYRDSPDGTRWVHPGDPPTTGGKYAKPTNW